MWMCSDQPHEYANYVIFENLNTSQNKNTFKWSVGVRHKTQAYVCHKNEAMAVRNIDVLSDLLPIPNYYAN